jgi:hypothetical protein
VARAVLPEIPEGAALRATGLYNSIPAPKNPSLRDFAQIEGECHPLKNKIITNIGLTARIELCTESWSEQIDRALKYEKAARELGEIPNIKIMYNDIGHSISIDFYIYISIFQGF